MKNPRYRFLGFQELPPSLGRKAIEQMCAIDPQHLTELKASRLDNVAKLSVAAQYVFLQVTGTHAKTDCNAIPQVLLSALSMIVLGYEAPLATFRAVTNFSDDTLKAHRKWARVHLGFTTLDAIGRRDLERLAIKLSPASPSREDLENTLNISLFDRRIVNPGPRAMEDLTRDKYQSVEADIIKAIDAAVSKPLLKRIMNEMFEPSLKPQMTVLEWLKTRLGSPSPANLAEVSHRVAYLRSLGVGDWGLHRTIPRLRLAAYAQKVQHRAPSQTGQRIDETQRLELICFLVHTLMALSNETVNRADKERARIKRKAVDRVESDQREDPAYLRSQIMAAITIGDDKAVPLATRHESTMEFLRATVGEYDLDDNESALVRQAMAEDNERVQGVLDAIAMSALRQRRAPRNSGS